MNRHPRQRGFTLLEVLIATILLSIMMVLLLGGMRIGADSWEQGERIAERTARMLVVENFFRSQLNDLKPLFESPTNARQTGEPPQLLFRGGSTFLEFAGTLPPQVRGGLYKFKLNLIQEGERNDLKLSLRPFSSGDTLGEAESIEDVLVLENVESLRFSYYRRSLVPQEPSAWMENWKELFLPSLIQVEIVVRGEPPWPPIIIAPKAETGQ